MSRLDHIRATSPDISRSYAILELVKEWADLGTPPAVLSEIISHLQCGDEVRLAERQRCEGIAFDLANEYAEREKETSDTSALREAGHAATLIAERIVREGL